MKLFRLGFFFFHFFVFVCWFVCQRRVNERSRCNVTQSAIFEINIKFNLRKMATVSASQSRTSQESQMAESTTTELNSFELSQQFWRIWFSRNSPRVHHGAHLHNVHSGADMNPPATCCRSSKHFQEPSRTCDILFPPPPVS